MPIETQSLDAIIRAYTAPMTSIRGRRVHRLLLAGFARFDRVVAAFTDDGAPTLLALAETGRLAACRSDGSGPAAEICEVAGAAGLVVTTAHDLLKDSLPVLRWTLWHPGLVARLGPLTIPAQGLSRPEQDEIAGLLQRLGTR